MRVFSFSAKSGNTLSLFYPNFNTIWYSLKGKGEGPGS
jgi:hypothetical protein